MGQQGMAPALLKTTEQLQLTRTLLLASRGVFVSNITYLKGNPCVPEVRSKKTPETTKGRVANTMHSHTQKALKESLPSNQIILWGALFRHTGMAPIFNLVRSRQAALPLTTEALCIRQGSCAAGAIHPSQAPRQLCSRSTPPAGSRPPTAGGVAAISGQPSD